MNDDKSLRNSFVGTSDYVSPEVLSNKEATKACDLWAVGCMIYQMMTGRSPFRSETEYLTFECILCHCNGSCPLQYPPVMYNTAAIELTKSLLQNEEINRLGAGAEGTDNGYAQLKAHKFFSEIVWDSILSMDPPYTPDTTKFPNKDISSMYDGASDEWLFDGDPTPIQEKPLRQSHGISIDDDDEDIRLLSQSTKQQQARQKYSKFLRADEEQVFTGLIYKRKVLRVLN